MVKLPRAELSDALAVIMTQASIGGWEREFLFAPPRKFRADFCWLDKKLIVECDGGTFTGGRHVRPAGYARDIEKLNLATLLGYRVLRFTTDQVKDGTAVSTILLALRVS